MLALVLAGCSSSPDAAPETPTPTATADPNAAACGAFSDATVEVGTAIANSKGLEIDIPAIYDEVALSASGDVKARILTVVDNLPEPAHMIGWMDNREVYNGDLAAVARACEAAGHSIQYGELLAG
ncbi:hypothetical protein [Rathayibacter sp. VKM Ac-2630]|uniref:hypothetical protein n=1 Tax=Rathayibacter sp. VKM Ac-2630 TaxID=1938617 RepID=UPI0009819FED|nr:hypothetical protein [Rathayibacter sp. VKM Ac-2630]OOB90330.1 hypothetical protein B0T42_12595 [Rathayibacter sp. VKM Ac-2630]